MSDSFGRISQCLEHNLKVWEEAMNRAEAQLSVAQEEYSKARTALVEFNSNGYQKQQQERLALRN